MTTVLGTATQTVTNVKNRKLVSLHILPTTATTQYDFDYIDKNSITINLLKDDYGEKLITNNFPQYTYGNFTLSINNASADEDFIVTLIFSEEVF